MSIFRSLVRSALGPPAVFAVRRVGRFPGRRQAARLAWGFLASRPRPCVSETVFGARVAGTTSHLPDAYTHLFGVWEPAITAWIAESLRPGDVFVDAGAYVGYHSLLASRRVGPSGAVVAIEASPTNFRVLLDNLRRNRADNVRAVCVAASDRAATVPLYRGPAYNPSQTTTDAEAGFELECEVEAAPLPEILEPGELERARLIKIDVEGHELEVLRALAPRLDSAAPGVELLVEVNRGPSAHLMDQPERVIEQMAAAGFHAYRIDNPYELDFYLHPGTPSRPVRVARVAADQADLVFSRRDLERL